MARAHLFGDPTSHIAEADSVAIIGLGRFGSALAAELMESGTEVLGIDGSEEIVQNLNGRLTHVVRADSTNEETLRQLSVHEFDRVVVGIGSDIEASILTASLLVDFGVSSIWAKAVTDVHGKILSRLGVHHVVYPEKDMGRKLAHLVRGAMQDFLEIEPGFALIKTVAPSILVDRSLSQAGVRRDYGVTVSAIRHGAAPWEYTTAESVVRRDDVLLVAGPTNRVEAFGQLR